MSVKDGLNLKIAITFEVCFEMKKEISRPATFKFL